MKISEVGVVTTLTYHMFAQGFSSTGHSSSDPGPRMIWGSQTWQLGERDPTASLNLPGPLLSRQLPTPSTTTTASTPTAVAMCPSAQSVPGPKSGDAGGMQHPVLLSSSKRGIDEFM